jgi:hypothetical protein
MHVLNEYMCLYLKTLVQTGSGKFVQTEENRMFNIDQNIFLV